MAAQELEKMEFAPEKVAAPETLDGAVTAPEGSQYDVGARFSDEADAPPVAAPPPSDPAPGPPSCDGANSDAIRPPIPI